MDEGTGIVQQHKKTLSSMHLSKGNNPLSGGISRTKKQSFAGNHPSINI
jgi:hypothetical protein